MVCDVCFMLLVSKEVEEWALVCVEFIDVFLRFIVVNRLKVVCFVHMIKCVDGSASVRSC